MKHPKGMKRIPASSSQVPAGEEVLSLYEAVCYFIDAWLSRLNGAVAQLGERLNGIQEVDGSIPFSSTIKIN